MAFDYTSMHFIGCMLLCFAIIVLCVFLVYIKKVMTKLNVILQEMRDVNSFCEATYDHLRNIEDDVYRIKQRETLR